MLLDTASLYFRAFYGVPGPDQPGDHVEQPPHGVDRGAVRRGHGLRHTVEGAEI